MRTYEVTCPACEKPFTLRSDHSFQNCPSCGNRLVVGFRFRFEPTQSHLPVWERDVIDTYPEVETYEQWIAVRGVPASERFKDSDFH